MKNFIELIAFDRHQNLQYEGKCKLRINRLSSMLSVEPKNEDFKTISAMFKWDFFIDNNILFVFAEHESNDFVLIFDDKIRCKTVFDFICKDKVQSSIGKEMFRKRFLIPFCKNIPKNDSSSTSKQLNKKIAKWINETEKKEKYIKLLKENNGFDYVFSSKGNKNYSSDKKKSENGQSIRVPQKRKYSEVNRSQNSENSVDERIMNGTPQSPNNCSSPSSTQTHQKELFEMFSDKNLSPIQKILQFISFIKIGYNKNQTINVSELFNNSSMKELNEKQVEFLFNNYKNKQAIFYILYQTPIIVWIYKNKKYKILHGNHRIAALKKWNATQEKSNKIENVQISFVLMSEPADSDKALIIKAAEEEAGNFKFECTENEIFKISRLILLYHPEILNLSVLPNSDIPSAAERAYGYEVRSKLMPFLNVRSEDKIPHCIFKICRISDDQFEACFKGLSKIFIDSNTADIVFTRFKKCPNAIIKLLNDETYWKNAKAFASEVRKLDKYELQQWLKDHECEIENLTFDQHVRKIIGKNWYHKIPKDKQVPELEALVIDKTKCNKSNLKRCPTPKRRLSLLQKWFNEWYTAKITSKIPKSSLHTTNVSSPRSVITTIRMKNININELTATFLQPLIDNGQTAIAAGMCHLIRHFASNKEQLSNNVLSLADEFKINGSLNYNLIPKDRRILNEQQSEILPKL